MSSDSEFPRERLARFVIERRRELDLTQDDVTERGGPSDSTLSKIESASGPEPSRTTLQKLDQALGWGRGSSREIMAGGRPLPLSFEERQKDAALMSQWMETGGGAPKMIPVETLQNWADIKHWEQTPEGQADLDRRIQEYEAAERARENAGELWIRTRGTEGEAPEWALQQLSAAELIKEVTRRLLSLENPEFRSVARAAGRRLSTVVGRGAPPYVDRAPGADRTQWAASTGETEGSKLRRRDAEHTDALIRDEESVDDSEFFDDGPEGGA